MVGERGPHSENLVGCSFIIKAKLEGRRPPSSSLLRRHHACISSSSSTSGRGPLSQHHGREQTVVTHAKNGKWPQVSV